MDHLSGINNVVLAAHLLHIPQPNNILAFFTIIIVDSFLQQIYQKTSTSPQSNMAIIKTCLLLYLALIVPSCLTAPLTPQRGVDWRMSSAQLHGSTKATSSFTLTVNQGILPKLQDVSEHISIPQNGMVITPFIHCNAD